MQYTKEQYDMLELFEQGARWTDVPEESMFIYRYLMGENLLQPREDIRPDWTTLTEHGKRVLAHHRDTLVQLQYAADKDAKNEIHQRLQDKVAVINALVPLVVFTLGVLLERWAHITNGFMFLWSLLFG